MVHLHVLLLFIVSLQKSKKTKKKTSLLLAENGDNLKSAQPRVSAHLE